MTQIIHLKTVISEADRRQEQQVAIFALLNLGILDSLASGLMSASDAVRTFFHAENCLFVHQQLHNRNVDAIMSHGVQLPDLFDILPSEEAQREFQHELAKMRTLCLMLLEEKELAV